MESPGHRANILGKSWDVIGVGAYKGPTGKKMWTVLFADKCGGSSGRRHDGSEDELGHDEVRPEGDAQADPEADARPTPVRTMPPEPTDPVGLGFGRSDRTNENGADQRRRRAARGPDRHGRCAGSLRVSSIPDAARPLETIVGDVDGVLPRRLTRSAVADGFAGSTPGSTLPGMPADPRGTRPHEALPARCDDRRCAAGRVTLGRRGRVRGPHGSVRLRQERRSCSCSAGSTGRHRARSSSRASRSAGCPTTKPRASAATEPASSSSRST